MLQLRPRHHPRLALVIAACCKIIWDHAHCLSKHLSSVMLERTYVRASIAVCFVYVCACVDVLEVLCVCIQVVSFSNPGASPQLAMQDANEFNFFITTHSTGSDMRCIPSFYSGTVATILTMMLLRDCKCVASSQLFLLECMVSIFLAEHAFQRRLILCTREI